MPRAFVFDAYGTLFDTQSTQARVEAACPGYGTVITQLWRLKQLEYTWLRSLMGEPFVDFWTVTRQSLRFALDSAGCRLPPDALDDLAAEYNRLKPYPEVRAALAALPAPRAILSNGSQAMLDALVEHAGFGDVLDAVISIDAARVYKPHPACYALVEELLHVAREDVVFVSSNGFDLAGAKRFGFTTLRVNRAPPQHPLPPGDTSQLYRLMRTLPEQLPPRCPGWVETSCPCFAPPGIACDRVSWFG
jgi:2-haloacid dehalogenase